MRSTTFTRPRYGASGQYNCLPTHGYFYRLLASLPRSPPIETPAPTRSAHTLIPQFARPQRSAAMISPEVTKELFSVRQVLHYLPASPSTEKGWTPHEQQLFWMALAQYPQGPWTSIAECIGSKSTRQAMTHAQKLRQKLKRWNKRLRRNPKVSSLMDGVSVTADGNVVVSAGIAVSSSRLQSHPSPVASAVSPWCIANPTAASSPMAPQPARMGMKQEQLRAGTGLAVEEGKKDQTGCAPDEAASMGVLNMMSGEVHWSINARMHALTPVYLDRYPSTAEGLSHHVVPSCGARSHLVGAADEYPIDMSEMAADVYVDSHTEQVRFGDPASAVEWNRDTGNLCQNQGPQSSG